MTAPLPKPSSTKAPRARKKPATSTIHGVELSDDYAWLRADNWQQVMRDPSKLDKGIRAYLEAENAHTAEQLADTKSLQTRLFKEMKGRMKQDDSTVPSPDGPFEYFTRYVTGGQYPELCRKKRGGRKEEVLLDGNAKAKGKAYWDIGCGEHSPDHVQVKAAGGVRDLDALLAVRALGVTRCGASRTADIMDEAKKRAGAGAGA